MKKIAYMLILLFVSTVHAADKPNILVILSDDVPWNFPGYQGGLVESPNIDRLAKDGGVLKSSIRGRFARPRVRR